LLLPFFIRRDGFGIEACPDLFLAPDEVFAQGRREALVPPL